MNTNNNFNIRKAKQEDILNIYLLEREYIIEHEIDQLNRWDNVKDKNIALLNDNIATMFVTTSNDEIIGHGYWSIYKSMPCIYSIYISKPYRNKGLATKLMVEMEKQIKINNHSIITLSTLITNPAQFLFNKLDYKEDNRADRWISYSKHL